MYNHPTPLLVRAEKRLQCAPLQFSFDALAGSSLHTNPQTSLCNWLTEAREAAAKDQGIEHEQGAENSTAGLWLPDSGRPDDCLLGAIRGLEQAQEPRSKRGQEGWAAQGANTLGVYVWCAYEHKSAQGGMIVLV